MAWTELTPRTLDDLYLILNKVSDSQLYVFRGHASRSWEHLVPSLHRTLGDDRLPGQQVLMEADAIAAFRRHARSLLNAPELSYFERILDGLTLMQHYGAPTRLLDWTLSPWVAAYFASATTSVDDGVIWAFDHSKLTRIQKSGGRSRSGDRAKFTALISATTIEDWAAAALRPSRYIDAFRYQYANPQMSAQQSLFTIAGTLGENHEVAIARVLRDQTDTLRIVIPAAFKKTLRQRLFRMNVSAISLFPNIDGVGRHITEALRSDFPLGEEGLLWTLKRRAQ